MKGDEKETKPMGSNKVKKPGVTKEILQEQKVLVGSHIKVKQEQSEAQRGSENVVLLGGEEQKQAQAANSEEGEPVHVANPENNVVNFQAQAEAAEHTESVKNLYGYGVIFTMATASGKLTINLNADDLPAQFEVFKYRHSKLMTINNITDPAKQAASFINKLPAEAVSILMKYNWGAANKSENKIDDMIKVLCAAKTKKTSHIVAHHRLLLRFMRKGEKFTDFKKALFTLAEQCGYPKEQKETLLRDLIISRHSDELLQRQYLQDLEDDVILVSTKWCSCVSGRKTRKTRPKSSTTSRDRRTRSTTTPQKKRRRRRKKNATKRKIKSRIAVRKERCCSVTDSAVAVIHAAPDTARHSG